MCVVVVSLMLILRLYYNTDYWLTLKCPVELGYFAVVMTCRAIRFTGYSVSDELGQHASSSVLLLVNRGNLLCTIQCTFSGTRSL